MRLIQYWKAGIVTGKCCLELVGFTFARKSRADISSACCLCLDSIPLLIEPTCIWKLTILEREKSAVIDTEYRNSNRVKAKLMDDSEDPLPELTLGNGINRLVGTFRAHSQLQCF